MKKKKQKKGVVNRKPHFFKVLLGDFTHHLRIPPKFLKHISGAKSKRVILHGPSGSKWHVELGRSPEDTFLTTGWRKFVKDHSLKEYEFLVFQYDGNMHFTVLIFDTSACEREDVFAVKPWRKQPVQSEGKKKGARAAVQALSLQIIKHEAQETNPMGEMWVASPAPAPAPVPAQIKTEECELPIRAIREKRKRKKISTRRLATEEERAKAQRAANAFTSPFPYIVVRMTPTHVYRPYLNVPNRFSREHLPQEKSSMVLRDPSGRSWTVNYSPSLRCQIAKGWTAFVRANKLEEGDFCALELVGPVELCVHIFRVVEEA
ncbi:B3 domain-containing protein Os01g0723500-like [Curcuma longa]|uniref:B3 domain-containing protein Os01g0723500-like n=1 Tax=Curcuma longa TaxID=136217 RepID=UPI003D9E5148